MESVTKDFGKKMDDLKALIAKDMDKKLEELKKKASDDDKATIEALRKKTRPRLRPLSKLPRRTSIRL
ncbi:MAG: hypothetical protein R3B54_09655 [Bdellovibrionota bacterium]